MPGSNPEAAATRSLQLQENERKINGALRNGDFSPEDLLNLQKLLPALYHQHMARREEEQAANRPDPRSPEQRETDRIKRT